MPNGRKYLDLSGLSHLWDSIVAKFANRGEAIKSISRSGTTFTATRCDDTTFTFTQQDNDTTYPKAVKSITRSGTTFTATCYDNTTFTFTQQDNNTTYSAGTGITLSGTTFSNKYAKTQLYNNATGTTGTVTLSASAANYNHMRIFVRAVNDDGMGSSVDVYSPNGRYVSIAINVPSASGWIYIKAAKAQISGTSITRTTTAEARAGGGSSETHSLTNNIYIVRVEGWNE